MCSCLLFPNIRNSALSPAWSFVFGSFTLPFKSWEMMARGSQSFSVPVSQGHQHSLNPKLWLSFCDSKGSLWAMRSFETGQFQEWQLGFFTGNSIVTFQRETYEPLEQTFSYDFTWDICQDEGCETLRQSESLVDFEWHTDLAPTEVSKGKGKITRQKEKLQSHSARVWQRLKTRGNLWKKSEASVKSKRNHREPKVEE